MPLRRPAWRRKSGRTRYGGSTKSCATESRNIVRASGAPKFVAPLLLCFCLVLLRSASFRCRCCFICVGFRSANPTRPGFTLSPPKQKAREERSRTERKSYNSGGRFFFIRCFSPIFASPFGCLCRCFPTSAAAVAFGFGLRYF